MQKLMLFLISTLLFVGCATSKYQKFKNESHAYVHHVTYDYCLDKLGAPSSVRDGSQEFVAVWEKSGFKVTDVGKLVKGKKQGERLELSFDKQTKVLIGCKYQKW